MTDVLKWLLEDINPAVKYRTLTELLSQEGDRQEVKKWIFSKLPESFHEAKGLWLCYYITALAECGLKAEDLPPELLDRAYERLGVFGFGCEDFMLLTALVKLGCGESSAVRSTLDRLSEHSLPDGGFLCDMKLNKLSYIPKSCYKANVHALMLYAACKKNGIQSDFGKPIADYFLNRGIFYKSRTKELVLGGREGWRAIDTFYPFEVMRIGVQNLVEAFSVLGYGKDKRLSEAWEFLNGHKNADGKLVLDGTLTKSYLPKETAGKPSKWVTFYSLLAEKEAGI